jgi:integrase
MDAVEYWMNELSGKADTTKKRYLSFFLRFSDWLEESPDEILENRNNDIKSDNRRVQRRYESELLSYITYLRDEGYSTSTQQVAFASVSSFFEMNYVPLRMRRGDYPSGDTLGYRAATRDDILRLVDATEEDPRMVAMVLFLKDSGLRVSDLIKLTYGDIRKPIENGEEFTPLHIITKKNGILAKTAIGPEAVNALKDYFASRRKGTRYLDPEKITDDSPLIRTKNNEVQALSRSGVSSSIHYLVKKAGLEGEISAHSLRKFTETRLEAAGVNPNWVDQIIGHRLPGSRANYSRPEDTDLFQEYKDAYNELRIFELPASAAELEKTATKLRKTEQEMSEMKTELAYQMSKRLQLENEMKSMQGKVNEMQDMLKLLYENPELAEKLKKKS